MSKNRENVVWQSMDKSWNIGFYEIIDNPSAWGHEDYDDEWDVDYTDSFALLLKNHPTSQSVITAADRRWGNPGSHTVYEYNRNTKDDIAHFEKLAAYHLNPALQVADEKKSAKKANLAHFKKLRELFTEKNNFTGVSVNVRIKQDDDAYTALGSSLCYTNRFRLVGSWLTIDGQKVFNPTTKRFNKRLHSVTFNRR